MKKLGILIASLIPFIFFFIPILNHSISAQTISGRIIDQYGNGIAALQLKIHIGSKNYIANSDSSGAFIFNNITDVHQREVLPAGYSVSENYPNPFNPRTRIELSLPAESNVAVEVFNLLGQKVMPVSEKHFSAGRGYVDLELNGLSNGFYIARVTINEKYIVLRKLLLMYGSQHLNTASYISPSLINKSVRADNSGFAVQIDSLVASNKVVLRKVFKNLPIVVNNIDLGNLTINRSCTGFPDVLYGGKKYNTVQIGNWCWLRENLDIGIRIPVTTVPTANRVIEKYCYNDDPNNCSIYGGLYEWNEAMDYNPKTGSKGICPEEWHIPTFFEIDTLKALVDNDANSIKSVTEGTDIGRGTNAAGFYGLLGGFRTYTGGYNSKGIYGRFWLSDQMSTYAALALGIGSTYNKIENAAGTFSYGFSIRCLKDELVGNIPPSIPKLFTPANGAANVLTTQTLIWNPSSKAISYTLQLSTEDSFAHIDYEKSGITETSVKAPEFSYLTTYYWRVSATNQFGTSPYSEIWYFTTKDK